MRLALWMGGLALLVPQLPGLFSARIHWCGNAPPGGFEVAFQCGLALVGVTAICLKGAARGLDRGLKRQVWTCWYVGAAAWFLLAPLGAGG